MNTDWKCTRPDTVRCVHDFGHIEIICANCIWGELVSDSNDDE